MRRRLLRCLFLGICWLSLVGIPVGRAQSADSAPLLGRLAGRRTPVVLAVERAKMAVVNIHSERSLPRGNGEVFPLSPSQNRISGMGTGILIDPRGYLITNQHVVEEVNVIRVRLADGTTLPAHVVARSPENDLALLKVNAGRPLPTIPLGTAADLLVGETVIAIGNAYGYEHTVSLGIVSAVKRDVTLNKEVSYKSLIQTDASINPGNSGGPLLNIHGEMVGMNVAIRAGAQGIGFAIPVDTVIRIVADLLRSQRHTWDGLVCRDRLKSQEDGQIRQVIVERVEANSPAAAAGLKPGDCLLRVGEVPVLCSFDVERALLESRPGDSVVVHVRRQEQEISQTLVLRGREPSRLGAADLIWRKLGLRLVPVGAEAVGQVNPQLNGGLLITAVEPSSLAARAGIRQGDILIGLHQWETVSLDNVVFVLTHPDLASFNPLSFYIIRAGQVRRGWLQQVE